MDDLVKQLVAALKQATFVVESVAHLQGHEAELLPLADHARNLISQAEDICGQVDADAASEQAHSESYNFDLKIDTGTYTIQIDNAANYGYFEHNELGDGSAGGIWFEDKEVSDYDGVFALPADVVMALRDNGFVVPPESASGE